MEQIMSAIIRLAEEEKNQHPKITRPITEFLALYPNAEIDYSVWNPEKSLAIKILVDLLAQACDRYLHCREFEEACSVNDGIRDIVLKLSELISIA